MPRKTRCVVRSTIIAFKTFASAYRRAATDEVALRTLAIQFQEALLLQTQTSIARYVNDTIDQRLAACLIDVAELLGSRSFSLTQEVLAEMLACQRSGIP
jgi:CRP-like cAMP-binding protein